MSFVCVWRVRSLLMCVLFVKDLVVGVLFYIYFSFFLLTRILAGSHTDPLCQSVHIALRLRLDACVYVIVS